MAEHSEIEWTDHTFNPWVGCTKVSPACDHCYAEGWAKRTGGAALWQGERRRTSAANWQQPLKWNRRAEVEGRRYRVFCASLADVFDNQVPEDWRADLWDIIGKTPHLDWLLLTKRPQNIGKMLPVVDSKKAGYRPWNRRWPDGWLNVWLGTTVENREEMIRRGSALESVRIALGCARTFWSCEPLLEDLGTIPAEIMPDWIIAGGESGPGARPMHPDWPRSLRDQCKAAGVPFHFKQWGEWGHESQHTMPPDRFFTRMGEPARGLWKFWPDTLASMRIGKASAGRLLDDIEHNGMPETPHD